MQRLAKPSPGKTGAWVRFPHPPPSAIIYLMPVKLTDITNLLGVTNIKDNPVATSPSPSSPTSKEVYVKKEVLFEWDTVTRRRAASLDNVRENRTLIVIGVVVALILVLTQNFLLIAVIASLIFLRYVLSAAPGQSAHHKVLNIGIEYSGNLYLWSELKQFFFTQNSRDFLLCVDTKERIPGRLFFVLNSVEDKKKISALLEDHIPLLAEEPKIFADKLYENALDKISFTSQKKE